MNVLSTIGTYLPKTATFIYNDYNELVNKTNLSILTNEIGEGALDYFPLPEDILHEVPFFNGKVDRQVRSSLIKRGVGMGYRSRTFSRKLNELIDNVRPEIIHVHFGTMAPFILCNITDKNIPVIIQFHGYDASSMLQRKAYRKILIEIIAMPNVHVIYVSKDMRNRMLSNGVATKNNHILYYGVDTDFFVRSKMEKRDEIVTFLQVSSFREKKGHVHTIRAFRRFLDLSKKENIVLVLAGDGPLRKSCEMLCSSLNLGSKVRFPGFVNAGQVRDLMNSASVFVHHSITDDNGDKEGIPNVIMEAMSMELPILSTYHSGIPELVENEVNGLLCNERDTENYASQMLSIVDWATLPENREKVLRTFDKRVHISNLLKIYEEIIRFEK